jgi:fucose 4-O-acetylase-like acetyltransferase
MVRNKNIDDLRGLAMLAMMAIHSTGGAAQGLSFIIWDFSQWAVPVFLFCSSYLFFSQTKKFKLRDVFPYLKKRAIRLFVPYYIFLFVFFLLSFFYAKENLTWYFLKSSLLLTGGLSYNWLVLVIAYLSILMPFIFLSKK